MKLWGGRFTRSTDESVDDFNSSIRFDQRMYRQDIHGSMAHAAMLGRVGVISQHDSELIVLTLKEILTDIEAGNVSFEIDAEDIHMNIEKFLIERIGNTGKMLHTGRSRNDQVALDLRMYLRDETDEIRAMMLELIKTLLDIAAKNTDTVLPGYTHLQRAQPITLAHHMMCYVQMLKRDTERLDDCRRRMNIMPLGSGALAATTYPLDREYVAEILGFDGVTLNSLDGVSDRDFAIELASCLSILMMHMSRYCEELVMWSSLEFGFVEMDDAFSTGSSIMPQKKNPDVAELVRGKTGRVYGDLMALLTMMKSLPLAYNKDMQEDKEAIFDCVDTVKMCLPVFTKMLASCNFRKDAMYAAASKGFTNATDFADYLVRKGIPFRVAHEITGKLVLECINRACGIENMSLIELQEVCDSVTDSCIIGADVYEAISLKTCIEGRSITGGPAPVTVKASIEEARRWLNEKLATLDMSL